MRTNGGQKTNGGKHPDEILAEIDRTRGEMDRTLSAIEHRLTPGQLVDQGLDYLRHSGANEFVQNLGGTAKQNPLPVAVTAIGLAWLMALGRQPAQPSSGSSTSTSSVDSMRGKAGDVADTARQQWQRARGGVDYLVNEQPFALGAIGLAIGALLGAAAPRTQAEQRVMGDAARNLTGKVTEKATETAKQVAEAATSQHSKPTQQPLPPLQQTPGASGANKKGGW